MLVLAIIIMAVIHIVRTIKVKDMESSARYGEIDMRVFVLRVLKILKKDKDKRVAHEIHHLLFCDEISIIDIVGRISSSILC